MASEIQSLLFHRDYFRPAQARRWALSHGFTANQVHPTENYLRVRQFDPSLAHRYRTIAMKPGLQAVVAFAGDEAPKLVDTGGKGNLMAMAIGGAFYYLAKYLKWI